MKKLTAINGILNKRVGSMEKDILNLIEKWKLERLYSNCNNFQKIGIIAYLERKKYEKGK